MITKERLQQLIEQGATIWAVNFYNKDIEKLELNSNLDAVNAGEFMKYDIKQYYYFHYSFENLFETKEDAEFALRFKRIQKPPEFLDLPTWEEFITNDKYNYYGSSYFSFDNYRLIVKLPSEDDDCEFIGIDVDGNTEIYHWEEATKENYLEACEICRKLWLGE